MNAKSERPKKQPKKLKNNYMALRLDDEQLAKLKAKAEEHNLAPAVLLRNTVLNMSDPIKRVHDIPKIDPAFMREFNSIGNNLNQITKIVHTELNTRNTPVLHKLLDKLTEINNNLNQIREHYTAK